MSRPLPEGRPDRGTVGLAGIVVVELVLAWASGAAAGTLKGPATDGKSATAKATRPSAVRVTKGIRPRPVTKPGAVFRRVTLSVSVPATTAPAPVLLASSRRGSGALWVDDVMLIKAQHADGTQSVGAWDFSEGCRLASVESVGPLSLGPLLKPGRNSVTFEFSDKCGTQEGVSPMYVVRTAGTAGGV